MAPPITNVDHYKDVFSATLLDSTHRLKGMSSILLEFAQQMRFVTVIEFSNAALRLQKLCTVLQSNVDQVVAHAAEDFRTLIDERQSLRVKLSEQTRRSTFWGSASNVEFPQTPAEPTSMNMSTFDEPAQYVFGSAQESTKLVLSTLYNTIFSLCKICDCEGGFAFVPVPERFTVDTVVEVQEEIGSYYINNPDSMHIAEACMRNKLASNVINSVPGHPKGKSVLTVPLLCGSGKGKGGARALGCIQLVGKRQGTFTEAEESLCIHAALPLCALMEHFGDSVKYNVSVFSPRAFHTHICPGKDRKPMIPVHPIIFPKYVYRGAASGTKEKIQEIDYLSRDDGYIYLDGALWVSRAELRDNVNDVQRAHNIREIHDICGTLDACMLENRKKLEELGRLLEECESQYKASVGVIQKLTDFLQLSIPYLREDVPRDISFKLMQMESVFQEINRQKVAPVLQRLYPTGRQPRSPDAPPDEPNTIIKHVKEQDIPKSDGPNDQDLLVEEDLKVPRRSPAFTYVAAQVMGRRTPVAPKQSDRFIGFEYGFAKAVNRLARATVNQKKADAKQEMSTHTETALKAFGLTPEEAGFRRPVEKDIPRVDEFFTSIVGHAGAIKNYDRSIKYNKVSLSPRKPHRNRPC